MTEKICSSCRKSITNNTGTAVFKCPSCKNVDIVRCRHCREIVVKYKCPSCGFEGPN